MGTGPIQGVNNAHWNAAGSVPAAAPHGPAGQLPTGAGGPGTVGGTAPGANTAPTADVDLEHEQVNIESLKLWNHKEAAAQGLAFRSWGDPHEVTGDGLKFDNYQRGTFTKLQSASGDFMLQTRQDPWLKNPDVTVNTAAAVKSGKDIVSFDARSGELLINGEKKALEPGAVYKLPGGGEVRIRAATPEEEAKRYSGFIDITTAKGDQVSIEQRQANTIRDAQGNLQTVAEAERYIDIRGAVSPTRKDGEVRGSLGRIDADTDASNDMVGRNGKVYKVDPKNQTKVNEFLEEWRAHPAEDLLEVNRDLHTFKTAFDPNGTGSYAVVNDGVGGFAERYDLNQDGMIDQDEFIVASAKLRAMGAANSVATDSLAEVKRFYDRDKDGQVTANEYFREALGWDLTQFFKDQEERKEEEVPAPAEAQG